MTDNKNWMASWDKLGFFNEPFSLRQYTPSGRWFWQLAIGANRTITGRWFASAALALADAKAHGITMGEDCGNS